MSGSLQERNRDLDGCVLHRRQTDQETGATRPARAHRDLRPDSLGDFLHDRQAKAATAGRALVAAPESLEDALPELFRNARALIIDDQTARSLSTRM